MLSSIVKTQGSDQWTKYKDKS